MAITQVKENRSLKELMEYDMTTHRFIPTNALCKEYGTDLDLKAGSKENADVERKLMADTIYDYMFAHVPHRNQEIILALIAEDANEEQTTIARALGTMVQYILRGGDEVSHRSGVDFDTSTYIEPSVLENMAIGQQVKRILQVGNGVNNSGVWKVANLCYEVSDVTDLVLGEDY